MRTRAAKDMRIDANDQAAVRDPPRVAAVNDLLNAVRAGGDIDVIRKGVELMLQTLLDAEATGVIGTERYERVDGRTLTQRLPGSAARHEGSDVELKIPKLRPELLLVDPGTSP